MRRLLLDPLGDAIMLALFDGTSEIRKVTNSEADKPVAIENAYRDLDPNDFAEIVLVNGPGNFTSLRVALGFVRGIALGLNIPSRGIGLFEVDYETMQNPPKSATLYRDARGGRFYAAHFENGQLQEIALTREIAPNGYSAENIANTTLIASDPSARIHALARLSERSAGQIPAFAEYVRPPDAALPSEAPLVILDE